MTVLKRSSSGMELELQILDEKGKISNQSKELIAEVKKRNKKIDLVHEETKNMVELKSLPRVRLKDSLPRLFDDLGTTIETADSMGLKIFGLGTYPGKFTAEQVPKKRYQIQSHIFDKKTQIFAFGHCSGFHYHYTLPRGVFDSEKKFLKKLFNSKTKQSLLDSHNLLVAIDPATSCLMQSSPFIDGNFLAKDSRMLQIRNPDEMDYQKGLFKELEEFGELPDYMWTMEDLRYRLLAMDKKMKNLMKKTRYKEEVKKKPILDFVWTVIKINKLGTLEYRGCDMNHPKYFAGTAILLKSIQRMIQQDFYKVEVSDIGIKEPFKVEGTTIYIPPESYVKLKLQPASAYKGFDDKEVYNYVKRFFNFAKKHTNKDYLKLLIPLKNLIERKETVSDILIKRVKQKGYSLNEHIPQNVCAEIALKHSAQFVKETYRIKDWISGD
ncbi:MAG: glutamate-cysteine ligase family protein [archaeon]|nr:glutamate-cysteine ligase family protein [archaeon]